MRGGGSRGLDGHCDWLARVAETGDVVCDGPWSDDCWIAVGEGTWNVVVVDGIAVTYCNHDGLLTNREVREHLRGSR